MAVCPFRDIDCKECNFFSQEHSECSISLAIKRTKNLDIIYKTIDEIISLQNQAYGTQKSLFKELNDSLKNIVTELKGTVAKRLDDSTIALQSIVISGQESKEAMKSLKDDLNRLAGLSENLLKIQEESKKIFSDEIKKLREDMSEQRADLKEGIGGLRKEISEFTEIESKKDEKLTEISSGVRTSNEKLIEYLEEEKRKRQEEEEKHKVTLAHEHNDHGVALYYRGLYDAARTEFSKAIELEPALAEAYNNLGLVLSEIEENALAVENFKKACELDPKFVEPYHNLGLLHFKKGEYEDAISLFEEALKKSPKYTAAYTNLGNALCKLEKFDEAIGAWEKACEIDPTAEEAKEKLKLYKEGK